MRVLQIVCHMYPHIGGIEQVARDISMVLRHNEVKQKIICFNEDAQSDGIECKRKETVHDTIDGIEVTRCGCFAKISSQCLSLNYPRELKNVMDDFQPDYVIFHYPNPYLAVFFSKYTKRNFKLIVFYHIDITKQKVLGKLFHKQTIKLLQRADKIISTTSNYVDGSPYLNRFRDKISIFPCCIDVDRLNRSKLTDSETERIREKFKDKIICFGIGRHVPYKGYKYLIEVAKYLDERFVIYIGGVGPLTSELKERAKELSNVKFLGKISDKELVGYLTACDIFCFPSITKNEAFGLALAEGMYFGKPAVTFTIPGSGVNYVNLNGETGIECPNCDSKAYAEALKKLADNEELRKRLGENARKRVTENFTFEIFKEDVGKMIDSLFVNSGGVKYDLTFAFAVQRYEVYSDYAAERSVA